MAQIPLSTLPSPPKDTFTRVGYVYAFETVIPAVLTRNPDGLFVRLNIGHESLGTELKDISAILSKEQVEALVKGKVVKL